MENSVCVELGGSTGMLQIVNKQNTVSVNSNFPEQ